jgi:hypothetical protein
MTAARHYNFFVKIIKPALIILFLIFLSACSLINSSSGEQIAENTATQFFKLLFDGEYAQAAGMYAGDLSTLQYMNPTTDVNDLENLWRNACTINGFQCLPIKTILKTEKFSLNEYHLRVEYQNSDGSLFVLEPCCGASEEEMPPVSEFDVTVIERNEELYVSSLPVLVP